MFDCLLIIRFPSICIKIKRSAAFHSKLLIMSLMQIVQLNPGVQMHSI